MKQRISNSPFDTSHETGLTLVELIVTVGIVSILATALIPFAAFEIKRAKERELRLDLWMMRDAIDHYKDACDRGAFQSKLDSQCYPPDLDTLVNGVDVQTKKVKFLRKIPIDPMTRSTDWKVLSMQEDPNGGGGSLSSGQNVFDVRTASTGTALDGTKYKDW